MNRAVFTSLAALTCMSACVIVVDEGEFGDGKKLKGSGVEATEEREVGEFSKVHVAGGGDVSVVIGEETRVVVTCDDNLIAHLVTRVDGDTLEIRMESGSYSFRDGPDIEITTPGLTGIEISGSADTLIEGLSGDSFFVRVSGSADVKAHGEIEHLEASVSGSGDLDLRDLTAQEAKVRVSGSGDADVTVLRSIHAEVNGSGDITYRGDPAERSTNVSGSGSITRR
jgi:hypothetical protein